MTFFACSHCAHECFGIGGNCIHGEFGWQIVTKSAMIGPEYNISNILALWCPFGHYLAIAIGPVKAIGPIVNSSRYLTNSCLALRGRQRPQVWTNHIHTTVEAAHHDDYLS